MSMLTYTYPQKFERKIKVDIFNQHSKCLFYVLSNIWIKTFANTEQSMVVHVDDTEWSYWDQVSFKQFKTLSYIITKRLIGVERNYVYCV